MGTTSRSSGTAAANKRPNPIFAAESTPTFLIRGLDAVLVSKEGGRRVAIIKVQTLPGAVTLKFQRAAAMSGTTLAPATTAHAINGVPQTDADLHTPVWLPRQAPGQF